MKLIHSITISAFIKEDENKQEVSEALTTLLPTDFENQGIRVEEENTKIDKLMSMKILTIKLKKERHTKYLINLLKKSLDEEQCSTIISQENRIDEQGNLYIRIDKKTFIEKGEAKLVDHGKCIHFKIVLATYPKTRENAIKVAKELFS